MPLRLPSPPTPAGAPWSPPSQRYSSRGSQGRPGGGGVPQTGPQGSWQGSPSVLMNGQRTAPTAATASRPRSPVAPALISSTVGRRPPIRTIAIDPPQRLGHLQRLLGRVQRDDRDLVLGELDRDRLLGLFQVDDLGDQPAAVDDVPELLVGEDDADRVLGRVDLPGPVQVADDLDHGEELDAGPLGDVR